MLYNGNIWKNRKENYKMTQTKQMELGVQDLFSMVIHEIKNPIALIKANIECMKLMDQTKECKNNLDSMVNELDHIQCIAVDFINTIKLDDVRKEEVFILDFVEDILEPYINTVNDITFNVDCNDEETCITANYELLGVVVKNLIKNSVEALESEDCNKYIGVRIKNYSDKVVLYVEDNGTGIDNNVGSIKNYTSKKYGTGVGLSIVKYIVSKYSGEIELYNNELGGCTARVEFSK